jgi:hypothetical protein
MSQLSLQFATVGYSERFVVGFLNPPAKPPFTTRSLSYATYLADKASFNKVKSTSIQD